MRDRTGEPIDDELASPAPQPDAPVIEKGTVSEWILLPPHLPGSCARIHCDYSRQCPVMVQTIRMSMPRMECPLVAEWDTATGVYRTSPVDDDLGGEERDAAQ